MKKTNEAEIMLNDSRLNKTSSEKLNSTNQKCIKKLVNHSNYLKQTAATAFSYYTRVKNVGGSSQNSIPSQLTK
jgi:hypothetical protein